jgi:SAM-dependent methyltransferase
MATRGQILADRFATANREFIELVENASAEQWRSRTLDDGEVRSVGTIAHHVAIAHARIARRVEAFAGGLPVPARRPDLFDERNAQHARENPDPDQRQTVELLRESGAAVEELIASLSDAALDGTSSEDADAPLMTTEEVIEQRQIGHVLQHLATVRSVCAPPPRAPTSHERMSGQPWDASYHDGPAPWDLGEPQPAVVRLAAAGGFAGAVLDAGCGTGDNTLHVAALGLSVLGVDVAETALAMAREKAAARGLDAEFAVADALHLERLGRRFQTVLDSGLFHSFDTEERALYAASLAFVTEHGGTLYVLCFGDSGPDTGPHPVSQHDLRMAFGAGSGWDIAAIEPERVRTRFHDEHGAPAWLATVKRT